MCLSSRLLILALMSLPWTMSNALAEASGPDFFRVTGVAADDVLNIREAPESGAPKLGEIPPDADGIRNLGCQGGLSFEEWQAASEAEREAGRRTRWCRIEFGGVEGWVAGWFLAEGTAPTAPTSTGQPTYLGVFGVADTLSIRAEPTTDAPVLTAVMSGTVLENHGCRETGGREWCQVSLLDDDASGWATAEFLEPASPSLRAGQGAFDATGAIPCAQHAGQPMRQCQFGVARGEGGSATVVVTHADGWQRALFFENGEFLSADASEAGGGFDASASKEADLFMIRVDEERYEIPEAVIFGG